MMQKGLFLNKKGCRRLCERESSNLEVVFRHDDDLYRGIIKDISLAGARIKTASVRFLRRGDLVTVIIPSTNGMKNVKHRGRIVWLNNEGFSIEFVNG